MKSLNYIELRIKAFFFALLICSSIFGQSYDFVKIFPGKGILFNNDSVLLSATTMRQVCSILKIKYDYRPDKMILPVLWDGFDAKTLEPTHGSEWVNKIIYKSIVLEFADEHDKNNLKLWRITMKANDSLKIYTDNGLMIGNINPEIIKLFPIKQRWDYYSDDRLTYCLYSYGISFQLEKLTDGNNILTEISIHHKNAEENSLFLSKCVEI